MHFLDDGKTFDNELLICAATGKNMWVRVGIGFCVTGGGECKV